MTVQLGIFSVCSICSAYLFHYSCGTSNKDMALSKGQPSFLTIRWAENYNPCSMPCLFSPSQCFNIILSDVLIKSDEFQLFNLRLANQQSVKRITVNQR